MSMIYESQTLVSAMQTRVGQYKDLKEQLTELKKGFESIVHLDDELQGQGAEAIKGFYKAQIDVVDSWLRLINRHVAFLSGIQGDTIEANLSETVVTVPFLEEELTNATRNSKEMVTAQKNDLKKILAGIDDIIQLEPFSDDAFFENIEKAETKRTQTIDKVNEIDHKWTTEYAKSEEDQAAVTALMEQLKVSSTRGGVVSPLYFNAAAYKNSEAYKNLEVRKKETAQYLKVKKEEAENRRIKDLKAQLDHVTDPDEFLKIAKQIGYENLAPTQQQYVMQLEAAKQTADIAKGIGVGLYDVGKDFVTGVWDFVTDPGETVEGVANSIMHPIQTYKYISKSISDSYERDMVNGDAYSRAHWVSYALGTVVTSVVGTKGAGAVAKTGGATTKAAAVKGVTKAKELATIPNLLPYNPKNQLSLAGGVPYNVVNGTGLKEQLISMAKVESNFQKNRANKVKIGDSSPIAPGGGLAAHEAKGGHLLERHVGKTDEELVKRLEEQSYITGASTFYDRATAERLVNLALTDSNNIEKIEKWLNDPDSDNKLALKFRGNKNIGKGIKRNNGDLEDYKNARIVLKKDGQGSYILTGFPTK
ncbi:ribonuclease YeeF family protein [Peribacillus frigoritolerans]|uniref:ribonuclease YeeF family protein n=1 Tax=Peribacillus frigoritolerans TaxID=450367 RepID=UPI0022819F82|nr:T7SS effector LXG polymorphic toxin [Peribacillus frigoritolerans]MCY8938850.1 T7SS effector LXG polymorphic toxin [Peribacillus frigoritolerans]